jgi:Na+-transporting methylmalonyl-CoA/oxaloacetate decarboxylase gamma subunit
MEAVMSALFVMLVVFLVLVILYVLIRVFTAIVRAVEANFIDRSDTGKGGA